MAKMFPDRLPDDVQSRAEILLYKEFQKQLSDDFTVFHSISWQFPNHRSGAKDGEADFVIACPNLGILVLEVKGGGIRYDGNTDKWYSNDNSTKDPFKQARDSKHSLLALIKDHPSWRRQRWIPIGHAVGFPDIKVNGRLRPDAPREIILDGIQLSNLSGWVQAVMNYYRGQNTRQSNFDANDIERLVDILSQWFDLKQVLGIEINKDKQEFKRLSEQQFRILDLLSRQRRVAVSGCAGSGKTLLALEKARRLNEQGFSVLLVCYNKGLSQFLRQSLGRRQNLHVHTFHGICEKLFRQAGFAAPDNNIPKDKRFNEIYPNLLIESANKLNWRVDAVIVDEGQDFCEDWWLALKYLLNDPDNGICYFFHDDNQDIYGRGWQPPLEQAPYPLTENWRNTKKIHSHVLQFYKGQNSITALGAQGCPVEIFDYPSNNNSQLQKIIGGILHRLVVDEGVSTKDIAILTTTRKQALQNKVLGRFRVKAEPDISSQEILCNTIHQFKGLESPVVILVETELRDFSNLRNWLYVGTSRARNHLIILRPDAPF